MFKLKKIMIIYIIQILGHKTGHFPCVHKHTYTKFDVIRHWSLLSYIVEEPSLSTEWPMEDM